LKIIQKVKILSHILSHESWGEGLSAHLASALDVSSSFSASALEGLDLPLWFTLQDGTYISASYEMAVDSCELNVY
jgi:hypothetical protein